MGAVALLLWRIICCLAPFPLTGLGHGGGDCASDGDDELGVAADATAGADDDVDSDGGGGGLLHATAAAASPQFLRAALALYTARPDAALGADIRSVATGALWELQRCFDAAVVATHLAPQVPPAWGGQGRV
jgi:hypothetical protein